MKRTCGTLRAIWFLWWNWKRLNPCVQQCITKEMHRILYQKKYPGRGFIDLNPCSHVNKVKS